MKKSKPRNNRTAGHNYERETAKEFRELGFCACSTSRLESRSRDNDKVDLCNKDESINGRLPYNIQCKTLLGRADYITLLNEMPSDGIEINVVLHKATKKSKAGLFRSVGQYALMNKSDFYRLVKLIANLEAELKEQYERTAI